MKEEFKAFVKKKPELVKYVNSGKMTWQAFYEQWSLYGEDEKVWNNYKDFDAVKTDATSENFSFSNLIDSVKKIDVKQVQKGLTNLEKVVDLLEGLVSKNGTSSATYEPRQLFKKFED